MLQNRTVQTTSASSVRAPRCYFHGVLHSDHSQFRLKVTRALNGHDSRTLDEEPNARRVVHGPEKQGKEAAYARRRSEATEQRNGLVGKSKRATRRAWGRGGSHRNATEPAAAARRRTVAANKEDKNDKMGKQAAPREHVPGRLDGKDKIAAAEALHRREDANLHHKREVTEVRDGLDKKDKQEAHAHLRNKATEAQGGSNKDSNVKHQPTRIGVGNRNGRSARSCPCGAGLSYEVGSLLGPHCHCPPPC
jgi:hypothetical protein